MKYRKMSMTASDDGVVYLSTVSPRVSSSTSMTMTDDVSCYL